MRWFKKDEPRPLPNYALEECQRHNRELAARNVEISLLNVQLTKQNVELSRELVRLSQRANPVVTDEEIEDPPTTRDVDARSSGLEQARRGEQLQRPAYPGGKARSAE